MKKNIPLYVLLIFLIIVNTFFLCNYMGGDKKELQLKQRTPPESFLVKELRFNDMQKEQFRALSQEHHHKIQRITNEIRELKDVFFSSLSNVSIDNINKDSIAVLIGDLEKEKDLEVYDHFEKVQELCHADQKEKFRKIIKDALRRGGKQQGPPPRWGGPPPHH